MLITIPAKGRAAAASRIIKNAAFYVQDSRDDEWSGFGDRIRISYTVCRKSIYIFPLWTRENYICPVWRTILETIPDLGRIVVEKTNRFLRYTYIMGGEKKPIKYAARFTHFGTMEYEKYFDLLLFTRHLFPCARYNSIKICVAIYHAW